MLYPLSYRGLISWLAAALLEGFEPSTFWCVSLTLSFSFSMTLGVTVSCRVMLHKL